MGDRDPRPLTVRIGTADSASDIAAVASLAVSWRVVENQEPAMGEGAFVTALAEWMDRHRFSHLPFIGAVGDASVAMAWLAIVDRVPAPSRPRRTCGYVQSAYVLADHRGSGVGTAVLSRLIDHAEALGLDYLAVHPTQRSFPFYRRLGFAGTERVLELDFRPARGHLA